MREAMLLPKWMITRLLGRDSERDKNYRNLWEALFESLRSKPLVLVLRDYHADNLMWLPHRLNLQRVGLLDFQDARLGHPAYDLMSLLQDARRNVSLRTEETMVTRYIEGRRNAGAELDEESFREAYAVLGAQRNAKIIGIFSRLSARDNKHDYLAFIPRVWELLERNLWVETLAPLKNWLDDHMSREQRCSVPTPAALKKKK